MKIVQVAGNETPFRFVGNKSKVNVIYHYYKILGGEVSFKTIMNV